MKLSEALRKVADHEEVPGWNWNDGLCANIYNMAGSPSEQKAKYWMKLHREYSGRPTYPIPADHDVLHGVALDEEYASNGLTETMYRAQLAYMACDGDMYTGCYGENRREMALYLSILFAKDGQ